VKLTGDQADDVAFLAQLAGTSQAAWIRRAVQERIDRTRGARR
jgi:hypothetical protein